MDFCKDVQLIFENSKNYNTNKKSRIYAMTVRLAGMFDERIRPILSSYKHRKDVSGMLPRLQYLSNATIFFVEKYILEIQLHLKVLTI